MGGWRDVEGRTTSERKRQQRHAHQAQFLYTTRRRPLTLLRGLAGFVLVVLLCLGLINWLR